MQIDNDDSHNFLAHFNKSFQAHCIPKEKSIGGGKE